MLCTAKTVNTINNNGIRTMAGDMRAHRDQTFCQISNFRLSCGMFQNSLAFCQYGRHQRIFCCPHANHGKSDAIANKPLLGFGQNISVF